MNANGNMDGSGHKGGMKKRIKNFKGASEKFKPVLKITPIRRSTERTNRNQPSTDHAGTCVMMMLLMLEICWQHMHT